MAINFPSSPTDGQKFTSGTVVYTYSTTTGTWTAASLGTALPFNYIINPSMQISQQNGDNLGLTPPYYMADQWGYFANASRPITVNRRAYAASSSRYALEYNASDSVAVVAADYQMIDHRIEGSRAAPFKWGTSSAEQVVLRFGAERYGNATDFAVALRNEAGNRAYVIPFSVSTSSTPTVFTFAIPGETTGTWSGGTGMGVSIDWVVVCGSTYFAPATLSWQNGNYLGYNGIHNIISTAGQNWLYIYDVGLYLDPLKTGKAPSYEMPPHRQTFSECQRYWQKQMGSIGVGIASTATSQRSAYPNQAVMRIFPTPTLVGTPRAWEPAAYPNVTAVANNYSNTYVFEHNYTSAAANTAGRAVALIDMTPSLYIAENARLA
jgi:hypothetical protein